MSHEIPPLDPRSRVDTLGGTIDRNFHRWLQRLAVDADQSPFIGTFATGSFTLADGEYGLHAEEVVLASDEEATLNGDSVLVVV